MDNNKEGKNEEWYKKELFKTFDKYDENSQSDECEWDVIRSICQKAIQRKMGVSMGIIQPMTGKVAEEFLRESEKQTITKETIRKCRELAKMITKL